MPTSYLVWSFLVGPLIGGGLVYYIQSRVRINEAQQQANIAGQAANAQTPLQVLQQQIQAKDQQLAQVTKQQFDYVQNSMARNDAATKAILELAGEVRAQTDTLKAVGVSLQAHREESGVRAGKTYEKIAAVNERLASMEASVKNAADTAAGAAKDATNALRAAQQGGA